MRKQYHSRPSDRRHLVWDVDRLRIRINPWLSYNLGKHVRLSLDHNSERMTVNNDRLYTSHVSQLTAVYQFNVRAFFRTIIQYVNYDYNADNYTFDIDLEDRALFTQLLFSYKINPRTVLFLGYADNYGENQDFDLTQFDRSLSSWAMPGCSNKSHGGRMKRSILFVLLMIVLTFCANGQDKSVIPLKTERNRSLVTVHIGDVVIPDIVLDTGFAFDGLMIYNPGYRDSLDLTHARDIRIGGAGSGAASRASMIDSVAFSLGEITMMNQRILVLQSDTYKGFPSNGIIGYSIFGHYVTELNYDNNTMILHKNDTIKIDNSWAVIPLYFKDNNIPWVDVSVVIEGEEPTSLSTYIDYAAGDAVVLLEKPTMKFILPKDTVHVLLGRGLSGDVYGKTGTISKLMIGPYALNNIKASFASAEVRSKQDNADAVLGSGFLNRFNLIFDYANKTLYLKPNTHFNDPFN